MQWKESLLLKVQSKFQIIVFFPQKICHTVASKGNSVSLLGFFKYNSSFCRGLYFWSEITSHHSMKSATLQLNKFQQAQNRHIVTIEHHYNTLWRDWGWKRQMSSRGIRTRDLAIHDDRRFWPRFSGILGALVKWLSSRTYAQVPLLEEVSFFMVWFDPDLPVLHIHLNNTGPTARLTARCYRARLSFKWLFIQG